MADHLAAVALPGTIERGSPVPRYFQLAELFEYEIVSGRWPPGTQLPSEPEICRRYGLSRTTVRRALGRLEQQGSITRQKGQGTYVQQARPRTWMLHSPLGLFQDEMVRLGRVTSRVLRAERGPLPRWATDALGLSPASRGATLERLRSVNDRVVLYNVNHLPHELADAALSYDDPNDSLYVRLRQRLGIEIASGTRRIEAVRAEERMASLLEVSPGAPLAFIESVSSDSRGRPFDCYRAWLRTDRLQIEIEIADSSQVSPARTAASAPSRAPRRAVSVATGTSRG